MTSSPARHARARHGHPRRPSEATSKGLHDLLSFLHGGLCLRNRVDGRDKHGHDVRKPVGKPAGGIIALRGGTLPFPRASFLATAAPRVSHGPAKARRMDRARKARLG